MISLVNVKQYCEEYWKIENYEEAVNDQTQTWHCHHRFEIEYNLSKIELQALGFYFNRPFCELIFLSSEEHRRLHNRGENNPMHGKRFTEESKQKMSDARKGKYEGENNPNYKYHITAEELYELYVGQGLSMYKIAEMYGCDPTTILHKLKKYNIKK